MCHTFVLNCVLVSEDAGEDDSYFLPLASPGSIVCYAFFCVLEVSNCFRVQNQEVFNYKIAARPDRRRQFEKELASAMDVALGILTACLNINELKEQVGFSFYCGLNLSIFYQKKQPLYIHI